MKKILFSILLISYIVFCEQDFITIKQWLNDNVEIKNETNLNQEYYVEFEEYKFELDSETIKIDSNSIKTTMYSHIYKTCKIVYSMVNEKYKNKGIISIAITSKYPKDAPMKCKNIKLIEKW